VKSIYVTSMERYSGKTALCLALGRRLLADGYRIAYLKPLSLQPFRIGSHLVDEDAAFVRQVLNLEAEPWELSPVIVTPEFLRERLQAAEEEDLMARVLAAFETASAGKDIILLEGGGSLREGHAVRLPTPEVARALSSCVLVSVKYRSDVRLLDDALSAKARLGDRLCGAVINRLPNEAEAFTRQYAIPYLEKRGVQVFGALPESRSLAALTVAELIEVLDAQVLTRGTNLEALVETLTVGAMTAEAALHRFREQVNKAVITGGDRTDIQLAALETSTTCLVQTGNLQPSPLIVRQAESFGVTVLLVRENTMETVERIERVLGKSRIGQAAKLAEFQRFFDENVDLERLYKVMGLI
jgi:hypothetical protein